ncbi:MAG: NAD(P)-dependent oxidoreductase [Bacteroidales bacterium]|nr:NAD(P)-dependent oxidoreductase [Bacteroidales bacterium]MBR0176570.1 NAD(P)-dependent oxidoreductase [Bacteroidales bacterium]
MQNIIVTGATGCVGSAVVRQAIAQGMSVTCMVHKGSQRVSNLLQSEQVHVIECNLSDYYSLELEGQYDAFIHLSWEKTYGASRDDADIQTRNIQYTLDAVKLAHRCGCKVFVGAGSQAEYGVQSQNLTPNLPVSPESGYGIAKFAAGKLSAMLCKSLGVRHNWVRILSVYGPNDGENTLISYAIRELKAGRSPELTKCEQIWDYLYADDAGDAILSVAANGVDGKTYPLGSGQGRKLSEYIEEIRQIINPSVKVQYGVKDYYPHQPMHLVADVSELTNDTGWQPRTSFEEGIRSFV